MRLVQVASVLFFVFFFLFLAKSDAWASTGHRIIGQLAYNMLTPSALEKVNYLLAQIPGGESLEDIAPWPDAYANTPEGSWSVDLHFCSLPLNATEFVYSENCVDNWCVVGAILNYTAIVLQSFNSSSPYSLTAQHSPSQEPPPISFLIHFAGDVHQPLHVAYSCDEGGNLVNVTIFDEPRVLHGIWDSTMITAYEKATGDGWRNVTAEIQHFIDNNPSFYEYYSSNLDPAFWANDSFQLVLNDCYVFSFPSPLDEGEKQQSVISNLEHSKDTRKKGRTDYVGPCPIPNVVNLPIDYYYHNIQVIQIQLAKAGVRAAALLNSMFPPSE